MATIPISLQAPARQPTIREQQLIKQYGSIQNYQQAIAGTELQARLDEIVSKINSGEITSQEQIPEDLRQFLDTGDYFEQYGEYQQAEATYQNELADYNEQQRRYSEAQQVQKLIDRGKESVIAFGGTPFQKKLLEDYKLRQQILTQYEADKPSLVFSPGAFETAKQKIPEQMKKLEQTTKINVLYPGQGISNINQLRPYLQRELGIKTIEAPAQVVDLKNKKSNIAVQTLGFLVPSIKPLIPVIAEVEARKQIRNQNIISKVQTGEKLTTYEKYIYSQIKTKTQYKEAEKIRREKPTPISTIFYYPLEASRQATANLPGVGLIPSLPFLQKPIKDYPFEVQEVIQLSALSLATAPFFITSAGYRTYEEVIRKEEPLRPINKVGTFKERGFEGVLKLPKGEKSVRVSEYILKKEIKPPVKVTYTTPIEEYFGVQSPYTFNLPARTATYKTTFPAISGYPFQVSERITGRGYETIYELEGKSVPTSLKQFNKLTPKEQQVWKNYVERFITKGTPVKLSRVPSMLKENIPKSTGAIQQTRLFKKSLSKDFQLTFFNKQQETFGLSVSEIKQVGETSKATFSKVRSEIIPVSSKVPYEFQRTAGSSFGLKGRIKFLKNPLVFEAFQNVEVPAAGAKVLTIAPNLGGQAFIQSGSSTAITKLTTSPFVKPFTTSILSTQASFGVTSTIKPISSYASLLVGGLTSGISKARLETKEKQITKPAILSSSLLTEKQISIPAQAPKLALSSLTIQATKPALKTMQKPALKSKQLEKQQLAQKTTLTTSQTLPPPTTKQAGYFIPYPFKKEEEYFKGERVGYNAYGLKNATKKKKRKWVKLNYSPTTKQYAKDVMARAVDNSISAQGKITPILETKTFRGKKITTAKRFDKLKESDGYFETHNQKFREYKKRRGTIIPTPETFIERRKYRLDTRGEKKGIQVRKKKRKEHGFGIPIPQLFPGERIEEGYNVFASEGIGNKVKWIKMNEKPMTRGRAISRMSGVVDNTISSSGRIIRITEENEKGEQVPKMFKGLEQGEGDDFFSMVKHKFKQIQSFDKDKKPRPPEHIEVKRFRKDTPGERAGLTPSKWIAKHKKPGSFNSKPKSRPFHLRNNAQPSLFNPSSFSLNSLPKKKPHKKNKMFRL